MREWEVKGKEMGAGKCSSFSSVANLQCGLGQVSYPLRLTSFSFLQLQIEELELVSFQLHA